MLSSGILGARLAVLRGLVEDPTRALALGPCQGEDIVDLLVRLLPESQGVLQRTMFLCLMCYQDPRTTRFMEDSFATSRDAMVVLRLAQRLAVEKEPEFFRPFLWHERHAQAVAAARICHALPDLSPRDRLRVALLLDTPAPPLEEETLPAWLDALCGPDRQRARAQLSGEVLLLWSGWNRLAAGERVWLLERTAELDPERARREVERLLGEGGSDPAVVRLAQRLEVPLPASLLQHADPELRALAIAAGLADGELESYLARSLPEASAALRRSPPEVWLRLLGDSRWQLRSLAVSALAGGDWRPLEPVRGLARSEVLAERVAAVELLRRWGDEEWLEGALLSAPQQP